MSLTNTIVASVLVTALTAGGIAVAGISNSTQVEAEVSGDTTTYTVADAGTVTVRTAGSNLILVDFTAADGWRAELDSQTHNEIEIDFLSADTHLRFNAELEDGVIDVDLENRTRVGVTVPDPTTTSTTVAQGDVSPGEENDGNGGEQGDDSQVTAGGDLNLDLGVKTYSAADAGTVTVDHTSTGLVLVAVNAAPGWSFEIDRARSDRIEIEFERGDDQEVKFRLRVDSDGELKLRVERDS